MIHALWSRKVLVAAIVILVVLLSMAAFAPWLATTNPNLTDISRKLEPPSLSEPFGTDHLGRSIYSRILYGARASLGSVAIIVCTILVLSFAVGGLSGYCGGAIDASIMRMCDVVLTFPTFILALFLIGVLGTGLINVIIAIVFTHWAWYARMVRGMVLQQRHREHVLAAHVAGARSIPLFIRHILPPVLAQMAVLATLDVGHMMLHVSGLSFLGLGVQPPTPEWGVMIGDARQYLRTAPQLMLIPGAMIFLSVMAFNLLGDALRDHLDPHIQEELDHGH
ncbi:nickel ABC transporter permease subunit NikC [Desulfovibrio inopinatus]|uniref:nickel ABC transporter permease subunit NikC n=1 Tax=Desulfovibrio inopinatus TaxID=102109 RepID=UPI0004018212|nr:nickel ABC transporter permease subunit NikC [Desulfovibrio inopinatus]